MEAGQRKGRVMGKSLAVDDAIAFFGCFGCGVEHGHLGKSELFYPVTEAPRIAKAALEWRRYTSMLTLEDNFAVTRGLSPDIV